MKFSQLSEEARQRALVETGYKDWVVETLQSAVANRLRERNLDGLTFINGVLTGVVPCPRVPNTTLQSVLVQARIDPGGVNIRVTREPEKALLLEVIDTRRHNAEVDLPHFVRLVVIEYFEDIYRSLTGLFDEVGAMMRDTGRIDGMLAQFEFSEDGRILSYDDPPDVLAPAAPAEDASEVSSTDQMLEVMALALAARIADRVDNAELREWLEQLSLDRQHLQYLGGERQPSVAALSDLLTRHIDQRRDDTDDHRLGYEMSMLKTAYRVLETVITFRRMSNRHQAHLLLVERLGELMDDALEHGFDLALRYRSFRGARGERS